MPASVDTPVIRASNQKAPANVGQSSAPPVQHAGQELGEQNGRCKKGTFKQAEGENRQAGQQDERQEGVAGRDCRRHTGQRIATEQLIRGNVEKGRNGKQQRHRTIGVAQAAGWPVMHDNEDESDAGRKAKRPERQPQRQGEGKIIDDRPQRRQDGEQESEQAHPVDDHRSPPLSQQREMSVRHQKRAELRGIQLVRHQSPQPSQKNARKPPHYSPSATINYRYLYF